MVDLIAEFQNQERGQASSPGYAATARLKLVGKLKSGKDSPSGKPSLEQTIPNLFHKDRDSSLKYTHVYMLISNVYV